MGLKDKLRHLVFGPPRASKHRAAGADWERFEDITGVTIKEIAAAVCFFGASRMREIVQEVLRYEGLTQAEEEIDLPTPPGPNAGKRRSYSPEGAMVALETAIDFAGIELSDEPRRFRDRPDPMSPFEAGVVAISEQGNTPREVLDWAAEKGLQKTI